MKFLILSLVMLGLTGTKGIHIPQQDEAEPSTKPGVRESIKDAFRHSFVFGVELFSSDPSEKNAQFALNKRILSFLKSIYNVGAGTFQYVQETFNEVDEEITKKYPVYRKSVIPVVSEFLLNISKTLKDMKEEIQPYYDQMYAEVIKQDVILFNKIRSIVLKDEKNWMLLPAVSNLITRLEPLKEEIRRELEKANDQEDGELSQRDAFLVSMVSKYTEALRQLIYGEVELKQFFDDIENPVFSS